jgi:putative transposase
MPATDITARISRTVALLTRSGDPDAMWLAEGIVTVISSGGGDAGDETGGMNPAPDPHYRHRFPAEIISHAVWLYHVFSLSLRDVELLLAERGTLVNMQETQVRKFGGQRRISNDAVVRARAELARRRAARLTNAA